MTDLNDDDLLAGEYVLGTLDAGTREAATARRATDSAFDAAVSAWEQHLTPLTEQVYEVEPPAQLWAMILSRLASLGLTPAAAALTGATILKLNRQVTRWKRATAASMALAACLALLAVLAGFQALRPVPRSLVAVLQKTDEAPAFVMRANLSDRALSVNPVSASAPGDKSYELWIIDPSLGPPKSLGLIGAPVSRTVLPDVAPDVLARATYAVTLESLGGSPTGAPTSAPVFFGHLLRIEP